MGVLNDLQDGGRTYIMMDWRRWLVHGSPAGEGAFIGIYRNQLCCLWVTQANGTPARYLLTVYIFFGMRVAVSRCITFWYGVESSAFILRIAKIFQFLATVEGKLLWRLHLQCSHQNNVVFRNWIDWTTIIRDIGLFISCVWSISYICTPLYAPARPRRFHPVIFLPTAQGRSQN